MKNIGELLRPRYTSRPVEGVLFRCNGAIIHKKKFIKKKMTDS